MLRFLRLGSMAATLTVGFAVVGVFGGCGPGAGSCSDDLTTVKGSGGGTTTCTSDEACTSDGTSAGCAKCDPNQCLPKNECVTGYAKTADAFTADATKKTTACRLRCTAQTDCPFNYTCVADDQGKGYCAKDNLNYPPAQPSGEVAGGPPWGVPCDPSKGFDQNPDCDFNNSFWCYGTSPTDANSFCTQFECTGDADCPGGWWCATINDSPNVTGPCAPGTSLAAGNCKVIRPQWGPDHTITACLPRAYNTKPGTYCAPCQSDVDCPTNGSSPQHCVSADANGGAEKVCAPECSGDANCPLDQKCADPGTGTAVCVPRAATCKGDGSLCSPCHSDTDCSTSAGQGYCVQADYSTEHFCTSATATCTYNSTSGFTDNCPALPDAAKPPNTTTDGVGCTYNGSQGLPLKQCYGGNVFGLGCYTFHCSGTGGSCLQASDCCSKKCDTTNQACL